mgnify:CR=1 FL=1|jgi:hypothetical protein
MDFKIEIFEKLWHSTNRDDFENWIYVSDEKEFQNIVGESVYTDIISESYSDMNLSQIKKFVFDCLDDTLKADFKNYILANQKVIKAICIKDKGLDYGCKKIRDWDLNIGQDYFVFRITTNISSDCHKITYQIFDPEYSDSTPYLIPAEMFEIKDFKIPDGYKIEVMDGEIEISVAEFSDSSYEPVEYSFWEDYFDDHKKAVDIFDNVLRRMGIKLDFDIN